MANRATATAINRDEAGYRRGLVLGLTMAEIMLLLVFCLLIAAAVIFKRDRAVQTELQNRLTQSDAALREARAQEAQKVAEISSLKRLVVQSGQSAEAAQKLDDEWRKLVASDAIVQRLTAAGFKPEELLQKPDDIRVVETLIKQGLSGNEIAASVKEAAELRSHLAGKSLASTSKAELVELAELGQEAKRRGDGEHDWPPIINLSEAKGYSFGTGRAELTSDFKTQIETSIAEQVVGIIKKYKASVVEVIGHTDEQPVSPRPSNLDKNLIQVLSGKASVDSLVSGDNSGLGMARAVSVAGVLRSDPRFASVTVLPLSGGQMIMPGDRLTDGRSPGDARERRRIEIRVRRPEGAGQ